MTGDWQQQVAENARRHAELRDRVAGMSITETTPDGMIRVTVSADGVLTDLALHQRYEGVPLAQLGPRIMACVRRAQARIPGLMGQALRASGVDDPAGALILADASRRFPAAPPDMVARTVARRAPVRRPEDTGWDDVAVLEDVDGDRR